MKYIERIRWQVVILILLEILALILTFFLGFTQISIALTIFLAINITMILWIVYTIEKAKETQDIDISKVLGRDAKEALDVGKIGIIVYNDAYEATWISDYLIDQGIHLVGKKLTTFIANITDLFNDEVDVITGRYEDTIYEVYRKEDAHVLFVKDITRLATMTKKCHEDAVVIGLIHLDNYMDVSNYEDETKVSLININIRQNIVDWAKNYGIMIRRMRSDRYVVVMNDKIYHKVKDDGFTILQETREKAKEIDVSISLSMGFARGSNDLAALDELANDMLELAQARGGDQVASKRVGGDVHYYGGNQEASSKRSRVRVRVVAKALEQIIQESDKIFISAHREMDFDAMGSSIALSRITQAYGKETYIVSESGGKEKYLTHALSYYHDELEGRHTFITDEEACRLYGKDDLLIVTDYHNPAHSNAPQLMKKADRFFVIDHHRRTENYDKKPLFTYIESGASSTCELLMELIDFMNPNLDISEVEATLMYLGILIDTNHFRMRTGFRTFEAAAELKKHGANTVEAEDLVKDTYDDFEAKNIVYRYAQFYAPGFMVACVDDAKICDRTLMSMAADSLLEVKGVEASFVIAKTSETVTGISSRSKGKINVQRIMERMQGGGHFSAAAVQRKDILPSELVKELKEQIDRYRQEEVRHENNLIE